MIDLIWVAVALFIGVYIGAAGIAQYYDKHQVDKWYNAGYAHGHKDADSELTKEMEV